MSSNEKTIFKNKYFDSNRKKTTYIHNSRDTFTLNIWQRATRTNILFGKKPNMVANLFDTLALLSCMCIHIAYVYSIHTIIFVCTLPSCAKKTFF